MSGIAFGVEVRRETQPDDRDANLDGTFTFTDMVTGETNLSATSRRSAPTRTPRARATSARPIVEFAVPLVSPEMDIPLVHRLDVQLAGRYEHYSDFGSVAKPKIALAWDLVRRRRLRGSYSEGLPRAEPGTDQRRRNTRAWPAAPTSSAARPTCAPGASPSMTACGQNISERLAAGRRQSGPGARGEHQPSFGLVLQPTFIPESFGEFTFTVDRWQIEQEQIVGLLGTQTALVLDYLNRVQGGANPLVNARRSHPGRHRPLRRHRHRPGRPGDLDQRPLHQPATADRRWPGLRLRTGRCGGPGWAASASASTRPS